MDTADRDRVLVADLAVEAHAVEQSECGALRLACGRRRCRVASRRICSALVSQTNGLRRNAKVPNDCRFRSGRLGTVKGSALFARRLVARIVNSLPRRSARLSSFDRGEPLSELASTVSASAGVRVFLAGRFLWTQSAASSADFRSLSSATSRSRSASDWSVASTILGALITLPFRLAADGAKGNSTATGFGGV
jgi:hypothetical protein